MLTIIFPNFTNPDFELIYDGSSTITKFNDGSWTGGVVVEDDKFHAERLGITPEQHRFQHELCHHLIGLYHYKEPYSQVLWQAAHPRLEPPVYNLEEEWFVTALQYYSLDKIDDAPKDGGYVEAVKSLKEVNSLAYILQKFMRIAAAIV